MLKFLLLFLFISLSAFSQKTITGVVSDSLNQPLESANLIAKPLQEKAGIKYNCKKYSRALKYFCPFKNVQNKNTILPMLMFILS
jgi:hypothetical protein